jgi:hypothetical protein
LLFIVLAMREIRRGRDITAGMLFALCSIKVHLFLLLPLLILRQRAWRFAAGLAMGGLGLFLISFGPAGRNWPSKLAVLLKSPISNPWPGAMPSIHGLTASFPHAGLWQIAGSIGVAVLAWTATRNGSFEFGLAAVLAGGILVAPHAYMSDCALIVPALLITLPLATITWQRYFHLFLLSPFWALGTLLDATWITTTTLIAYLALLAFVSPKVTRLACSSMAHDKNGANPEGPAPLFLCVERK